MTHLEVGSLGEGAALHALPQRAVPAVVHRIWIGPPMPESYVQFGESFRRLNPGWEHVLWGERELAGLAMRNRSLYDRAEQEAPRDSIRWRVDIARLEILEQYGGIYADCDAACLAPLDSLLGYRMFLPESPNDPSLVTNAVMGSEPGHPFLAALIDGLPANAQRHRGGRLVDTVGGKFMTRMLHRLRPVDVAVLPWWMFAGRSIRDRDRGRAPDLSRALVDHQYANTAGRTRR